MTRTLALGLAFVALVLTLVAAAPAAALKLEPVGSAFDQPTFVSSDPSDAGRLFVTERKGTIQLLENGVTSEFADLTAEAGCGADCGGERGLLSLALAPDFAQSGQLFAAYADDVDGEIHVDELFAAGPDRDSAIRVGELLAVEHADSSSHNGGQLQLGPDGFLYLATGDGGGVNDQYHHAQDPTSPLGKILRFDPDLPGAYEIWSLGLRNPFRFSFDRANGDLAIADVGQGAREEIDFAPSPFPGVVGGKGANYGWNCEEGLIPGPGTDPECATLPDGATTPPVFDYPHNPDPQLGGSKRCSIIGGYVVRDPGLGALAGRYVYSDYCGGALRSLGLPAGTGEAAGDDCSLGLRATNPVSFGEDADGRIYLVEQDGGVFRLTGAPPADCPSPPIGPPAPPATGPGPGPGSGSTAGPGTPSAQPGTPTFVGIKAQRRRVERGRRALLTVFVTPCDGRRGTTVELLRDGRANGSRYLSRACTAHFAPRIRQDTAFAAVTREERGFAAGASRQLQIRLAPTPRR